MALGGKVVEWDSAGKEDIVWRFPDNRLNWGSTIIVRENQWGMFFKDGKALDMFGPGRHRIKTMDLPLLGGIIKLFAGDVFEASCVFISQAQFDGKFGGRTQTQELAPLMFNGQYWFKVEDPRIFVNEVCGNNDIFTTTAVNNYIRGYFNENLIQALSQYTLRQVYGKLEDTSLKVKVILQDAFKRIGLELVDVKFLKIDTEEKYRDRLFFMQTGGVGAAGVLASETQKDVAKELGKSKGGAGTAFVMSGGMNTNAAVGAGAGDFITCAQCGTQLKKGTKFCSNCGKDPTPPPVPEPSGEGGKCKNCGDPLDEGQKFCEKCGHPVNEPLKCYKCGDPLDPGQRFCEKCGAKQ
ncbi:MAG: zinc-ribbon domain-containing protein [Candidatus Lokiarchaeota archaeon]|nr:zinc-ribbon domain-containing protein [Candidatus Lokiarchaeota archaeon]